jgi:opacity protein-like surface antigen
MNRTLGKKLWIGVILALGCLVSAGMALQKIKLTVNQPNARIHVSPDETSQVIQEVEVGAELEAERRAGDWYEVKVQSRLGVLLTGYLHRRFVDESAGGGAPVTKPAQKKTSADRPQRPAAAPFRPRGDLAVRFGTAAGSFLGSTSAYSESWSDGLLSSVGESGTISHEAANPLGLGLSFSYYFAGGLGLQVKLDYNFTVDLAAEGNGSTYRMSWSWTDGRGPFDVSEDWALDGDLSLTPISLNLVYRVQGGGRLVPYIGAGVSYFIGKVNVDTRRGWGFSWEDSESQYIDYIDVPVRIDESIGHLGFNLGGGVDLLFSRGFGLNLEAAYFVGKSLDLAWQHASGTFAGNIFPDSSWVFDQEIAEALNQQVDPLQVKTSFFKLQAGFKVLF